MRWSVTLLVLAACGSSGSRGGTTGDPDATTASDTASTSLAPDGAAPETSLGACPATTRPENSDALCRNGLDDDCNGYFDCFDFACSRSEGVDACCGDGGAEASDERCQNGLDDDCDGYVDCRDFDCSSRKGVTVCCGGASEADDAACQNHWDDDCDGYVDCRDFDCLASNGDVTACCGDGGPEDDDARCANGIDDDCNGFIDCRDFACSRADDVRVCCEAEPERGRAACSNQADDDCDGRRDCDDEDCAADPTLGLCGSACTPSGGENSASTCGNGIDEDCDGYTDCIDFGCGATAACSAGGDGADCAPCTTGADCEGGACVEWPAAPAPRPRFCSRRCTSDADCSATLPTCGDKGFCGSADDAFTRTCAADGGSYTVVDGCGYTARVWSCEGDERCVVAGGQATCEPPCIGLGGRCQQVGGAACCAGLVKDVPLGSDVCSCVLDDGAACTGDTQCISDISECRQGVCTSCLASCDSDADCCSGGALSFCNPVTHLCSEPCDPSTCHAFCIPGVGCCQQSCSGGRCVTGECAF